VTGQATLIVSPLASRIRGEGVRRDVTRAAIRALAKRGVRDVHTVEASEPAAIREAAATAVHAAASMVVLVGGDGTVRDASGALVGSGIPIGIVPCGTGNLYASAVGVPRDLDQAIAALATGDPRPYDVGEVGFVATAPAEDATARTADPARIPFVVACGTGFDAAMIAATSRESKRRYGVAAYFLAASRLLGDLRARPTVLTVDGARTELESMVVLVANCGEAIPGRLRPRLPIEPDDGLLHVFVLPQAGIIGGIRGALELMTAESAGVSPSGAAARLVGREVRVEVMPEGPTQIDGDPFPAAGLDARIHPAGLLVLRA
jgi:diacylglycerol kinase (ATP)